MRGSARRALQNVRALAMKMRKGPCREEAAALLRFCAEAGVVGSVVRGSLGVARAASARRGS
jgi:hypothetical protein